MQRVCFPVRQKNSYSTVAASLLHKFQQTPASHSPCRASGLSPVPHQHTMMSYRSGSFGSPWPPSYQKLEPQETWIGNLFITFTREIQIIQKYCFSSAMRAQHSSPSARQKESHCTGRDTTTNSHNLSVKKGAMKQKLLFACSLFIGI